MSIAMTSSGRLCAVAWITAGAVAAGLPQPDTSAVSPHEIGALAAGRLNRTGCVRAVYENDISHDRYLIGFDLSGRSWYKIYRGTFFGFTPSTGFFRGSEGGPATTGIPAGKFFERWPDEYIPSLYIIAVCAMPEVFRDIRAQPDGGAIATLMLPDGQPMTQEVLEQWLKGTRPVDLIRTVIEVDGSGLLRRVDSDIDALDRSVEYASDSLRTIPLASYVGSRRPGGIKLISFTHDPAGCPEAFTPSAVAQLAKEARTSMVVRRLGNPRAPAGAASGGPVPPPPVPTAPAPLERAARPLALAALATIAIGAWAWWRSRR